MWLRTHFTMQSAEASFGKSISLHHINPTRSTILRPLPDGRGRVAAFLVLACQNVTWLTLAMMQPYSPFRQLLSLLWDSSTPRSDGAGRDPGDAPATRPITDRLRLSRPGGRPSTARHRWGAPKMDADGFGRIRRGCCGESMAKQAWQVWIHLWRQDGRLRESGRRIFQSSAMMFH